MEHLFPGMEPPERTKQAKQNSLAKIKEATAKKRRLDWQFYATVVSAIAVFVLFILTWSEDTMIANPSSNSTTTVAIESITMYEHNETMGDRPLNYLKKWYYIGQKNLSKEQIEQVAPFIKKAITGGEQVSIDKTAVYTVMLVTLVDGSVHAISLQHGEQVLYNWETGLSVPFTTDDFFNLFFDIQQEMNQSLSLIIKLLLLFGVFALYATILQALSPNRRLEPEKQDVGFWKSSAFALGFVILLFTVLEYSMELFGGYNLLFIVTFFTVGFTLIAIYHIVNRNPRSFWEIPISVVFFTLFTIIFTL